MGTKADIKRREKLARQVLGPNASEEQVRELAQQVTASLAARRAPGRDPAWRGRE